MIIRSGAGTVSGTGGGASWMIACIVSTVDGPLNGNRPATSSKRRMPNENTSLRASRGRPVACSGDM